MKVHHNMFEKMLATKGVSKKDYATYAQIPYFTVAGWKKSNSVPAYAIVLLRNMPSAQTVTAKQLIDAGLPRAIFWNNNLTKTVPSDIFIVSTLKRAYNGFVIDGLVSFFGRDSVLLALMKYRNRLSDALIQKVFTHIDVSRVQA
jgi:hypothetical protein